MFDRTGSLSFERNMNRTHFEAGAAVRGDGPRTSGVWARRRLASLQAVPLEDRSRDGGGKLPASLHTSSQTSDRKGIFARVLDALHESRCLQAARIIRDSPHLVEKERQ
jgi:hypothetical protein